MDITTFFTTSLTEDVYQTQRDHLLDVYLKTLASVMHRLSCQTRVITMDELKASLSNFAILELIQTITFKSTIMSSAEKAPDINEMFEREDMFDVNNFRNPAYKEIAINRLSVFDKIGLFD